jgi:hypothetical protein
MQYWTDDDDPINICYDNVFKSVFTQNIPASRKALSELVSAITQCSLSIVAISAKEALIKSNRGFNQCYFPFSFAMTAACSRMRN